MKYVRDIKTSYINFIANMGGLMGLCMGFSLVSIFEIVFFCAASFGKKKKKPLSTGKQKRKLFQ